MRVTELDREVYPVPLSQQEFSNASQTKATQPDVAWHFAPHSPNVLTKYVRPPGRSPPT